MDIKRLFGEINKEEIISIGDNIKVRYYENKEEKENIGILINADKNKIVINGNISKKEIETKNIIEIKKVK